MKYSNHESDLYVLPETDKEREKLQAFVKKSGWCYEWSFSDVEGQSWYGKHFLDIVFGIGLKEQIINHFKEK